VDYTISVVWHIVNPLRFRKAGIHLSTEWHLRALRESKVQYTHLYLQKTCVEWFLVSLLCIPNFLKIKVSQSIYMVVGMVFTNFLLVQNSLLVQFSSRSAHLKLYKLGWYMTIIQTH